MTTTARQIAKLKLRIQKVESELARLRAMLRALTTKPDTAKKPRSADRHLEPNRDRHRPGYMRAYMRQRRAAEREGR
jgi:hypothetical protein